jgi:large subunit ribosomal protein L24e
LEIKDSTFEFEKRRNRPVKYNRETMEHTLKAMKRVSEIQSKRQEMFFKMRMRSHKATQKSLIKAVITKGTELLAPAAANREVALANATKKIAHRFKATEGSKMQN